MTDLESIARKITGILFTQQPFALAGFIAAAIAALPIFPALIWMNCKQRRIIS